MPKKILIVDDEKSTAMLYQVELEAEGYQTEIAEDGEEALKMMDAEKFDLVLLDIKMPKLNGIETLEEMAVKKYRTPVLINTAYASYKDNFLTWLAEDYIIKSSDPTELKNKVKELLERAK